MARDDRYVFWPVALCSLLGLGGVLLLLLGLWLITTFRDGMLALALIVLIADGFLFLGVYLLGRCAVLLDGQGVRLRGFVGDWREIRWEDVASISVGAVASNKRPGGQTMLIIRDRAGVAVEVIRNERTLAMLRRYSPVPVPE